MKTITIHSGPQGSGKTSAAQQQIGDARVVIVKPEELDRKRLQAILDKKLTRSTHFVLIDGLPNVLLTRVVDEINDYSVEWNIQFIITTQK